jgi:carbon-monoxide dehydrogenase small subunit
VTSRAIRVEVNGRVHERTVEVRRTLADFLREDLGLTGTHLGCEHGVCGACTIWFDGEPARACLLLAPQAHGARIVTVEALGTPERLHPLQQAFRRHHALQCGFCTPGILMTMLRLLEETPRPSEAQIREALAGHLCRCTGYQPIVRAVQAAAGTLAAPLPG